MDLDSRWWPGKDYYNPSHAPIDNVSKPDEDFFDRKSIPRMPWHDVHVKIEGEAARDIAINFIERWNYSKRVLERITAQTLKPKISFCQKPHHGSLSIQVLRSLGDWHLSNFVNKAPEQSIYEAYLYYIETAQHFIYIENQYFISSLAGSPVKNKIAQAILDRIQRAIDNNEMFRVIIILPVHPEGTFRDDAGIRYIMKWQYQTLNRSKKSLLTQLKIQNPGIEIEKYISINALRKAEYMPSIIKHVTEQIYVHTKLMIVDDRVVIIGSANINDRSMEGNRDSEIAVVIEDRSMIKSSMCGNEYEVGEFAYKLRLSLWKEHLGIPENFDSPIVKDPISDTNWKFWLNKAKENTEIYKKYFPQAPSDHIGTLSDIRSEDNGAIQQGRIPELDQRASHLILFPLEFLGNQNQKDLHPDFDAVEIKLADIDIFI